ncbi:hypothetical protein B0H14DRAFT_1285135 [Mycena olivaceomarginata]|nr:hypothetical protein B0H14DRAFT_1285135 [Mycena olivaceomarginata]
MNARPELAPPRARESGVVRLPSYQELTAVCGEAPPRRKTSRSNLLTAGPIPLPPLKVLKSPISNEHLFSAAGSGLYTLPTTLRPMKRRYYDTEADDAPNAHSYLDLFLHSSFPPHDHRRRVGSPQSTDSASGISSASTSSRPWPPPPVPVPSTVHIHIPASSPPSTWHHTNDYESPDSISGARASYNSPTHDVLPSGHEQPRLKFSHAKAGGRTKKQALSCYFCRERKIACGRPDEGSGDETCKCVVFLLSIRMPSLLPFIDLGSFHSTSIRFRLYCIVDTVPPHCSQCARRKIECRYPTVSHRGQHSRIKAQSAARKEAGSSAEAGLDPMRGMEMGHRGGMPMERVEGMQIQMSAVGS